MATLPPMLRPCLCSVLALAACGGGGGGGGSPPATQLLHLIADPIRIPANQAEAMLTVRLADVANANTAVLLECDVVTPSALAVASNPLQPLQAVPTLDGDVVAGTYHVLCGDAQYRDGQPLRPGPLFTLRLATQEPRQRGSHTVLLRNLVVATADGTALPVEPAPTAVQIVID